MEMELGLRLGDNGSPFGFPQTQKNKHPPRPTVSRTGLDFCLLLRNDVVACVSDPPSPQPPPQLDLLLPHTPLASRSSSQTDVSEAAAAFTAAEGGGESPRNPLVSSSLELELCKYGGEATAGRLFQPENNKNMSGDEVEDHENMGSRKKLRLSRQQSAFLEESFKEHHTLYPKQKLELARRLNLRPRQVEVWFQNRRARTKLKQTEVDCEYLKKCCETLSQHNTKLLKELSDLRALKTTDSLYFHLPPTTLTICPSCERAAAAAATAAGKHLMSKPSPGFSFSIFTNSSDQTE